MSDDTDNPPEREMKDFQFRQMKKARVFEPVEDLPKERSSLLAISNKFGLTFVGLDRTFKVYLTQDILDADKADGNSNETALAEVTGELALHHLALSCDELTLSVCGVSEEAGLSLAFYDVRTFMNKTRLQKLPFASLLPPVPPGTLVQDLKWNPAQAFVLAVCMSDGSMRILDVSDSVKVTAELPASSGITCVCWSPKGKQVAAGKMNATVSQYTPALEEKKVIPCPHFYTSDEPVKVLDVLWLRTYVFAVVYAAADGSLETPPELVFISLPKKDEKVETKYLNFSDTVYGSCTERQHHYFLSHVEEWDLVFAASAASIEVSVIARQEDKIWELWILEDASRAELPVTEANEDTLPLGLAIDYTSQQEIHISDEKTLPPVPIMLMLSTEGLLCPFALLNLNPGTKQLVSAPSTLALEGERIPKPGEQDSEYFGPKCFLATQPPKNAASITPAPATFPNLGITSAAASTLPGLSASSSTAPFSIVPTVGGPVSSSSTFSFSAAATCSTSAPAAATPFGSGSSGFSFASKPPSDAPSAASAFFFTPSIKPSAVAAMPSAPTPQSLAAPSPPTCFVLFCFFGVCFLFYDFSLQAAVSVKALEKQLQQKKDSDPIMAGILEEIAHFQKELDDLKARSTSADFKVGTSEEMKELRKESEDLHIFTLEIKETTESLHGDIGTLNTTLLEGFAGAEEAKAQSELRRDRNYRQLLYKKPLDPRSEEQLKEIRRLYQYVMFAVEDVNDVLNVEWEKHLERKKKQKHMIVPGRENLFTTLSNNLYIINQQKNRLDHLVKELTSLRLYNKAATQTMDPNTATATTAGLESELESLRSALLKTRLDPTTSESKSKSPIAKISPAKQSQLRNFLSKGQMPPVRSTAPANLSRSAFLSPKYYEDLDDVSSTSSLSQSLEPHPAHLELEEDEIQPEPLPPVLSTPRHPAVVRTPSIQPGFGAIQSTPLTKIQSVCHSFNISVPTNKINLSGADSTALATKTVKHGAPPTERTVPVTISAQQAAATAALRRQMANQKTGRKITQV
uniref:Nuclear pore complex protein Nup214 n=1 Tax=Mola mola TaxID=94237 RepID=A0A3Q3VVS4_MOLML